jgi:hypothetical protein
VVLKNLLVLHVWFLQRHEYESYYFHGIDVDNKPYRDYGKKYLKPMAGQKI